MMKAMAVAGLLGASLLLAQTRFEAVSIKPYKPVNSGRGGDLYAPMLLQGGRFRSRAPLITVIGAAYDVPFFGPTPRISGGPDWIRSADLVYEIEATPSRDGAADGRQMLQTLLADRFHLQVRRETKETPVYVITVAKGGPKLTKADIEEKDCPETSPTTTAADANRVCHRFNGGRGRGLHARAVDMADLVKFVESWTDRPLIDETALTGLYRIESEPWLPMELDPSRTQVDGIETTSLPTIFTVFERMGLKMIPQKRNLDTYVIERVEKPAGN